MDVFKFLAGALLGSLAAWFYAKYKFASGGAGLGLEEAEALKSEKNRLAIEKAKAEESASMLKGALEKFEGDLASERAEVRRLDSDLASKKAELSAASKRWAEEKTEFESLQKRMSSDFENLANRILDEKTKKFSEQGRESISAILAPLKEKLSAFEVRVNQIHSEDTRHSASLMEQIKTLTELNNKVTQDTTNLTNALKGKAKFQGTWGEVVLQETLELMGLKQGEHFLVQKKFMEAGEEKEDKQPDIIVRMPSKKDLVVDSKVNLTAYSDYFNAFDDAVRAGAAARHLEAVENHIKGLGSKDYQSLHGINSLDFTLMFMPLEAAYLLALEEARKNGKNLLKFALEKKIMIVTPSTILPVFRTVAHIWDQEKQTRNAMEIARQAGALYDKFVGFVEDFKDVSKSVESAHKSCDDAMNKLTDGTGNLVKRFEDLKELGAKTKKALPSELTEKADSLE
jgi:DNA recombination protein RmuC